MNTKPQDVPVKKWRHVSEIRHETLNYIKKRRIGLIKSIRTPWPKLNNVLMDGLEWGSIYVIGGRPGTGKTSVVSQITNQAHMNNPGQDFAVLNFQFEMGDRVIGARELTKPLNMDIKKIFSAHPTDKLTNSDLQEIENFHTDKKSDEIYYVTDALNAKDFTKEVLKFYSIVQKPIIITIDHSVLVKKGADELNQMEALYNLSSEMVYLKKKIPDSMYIVLSQMNRSIEDHTRRVNGNIANYPTSNDLFAADALMQNADAVILLNSPDKMGITEYGPEKIKVENGMIVFHLIKNRFGELCMLFFKQDLKYFEVQEGPTPQTNKVHIKKFTP
jgi:replicative DNA helicase